MSLSDNVEGIVELNQTTLCICRLSKGYNTGIAEYINLENSGNNRGYDQKDNICMLPILLQLLPRYSIYNIDGKFKLNQKTLCACALSK